MPEDWGQGQLGMLQAESNNKGYLTDGDNCKGGHGDKKYWHSCREKNPNAEVAFAEKCIREDLVGFGRGWQVETLQREI